MKKLPICQSCRKEFQARLEKGVKSAYRLGLMEGRKDKERLLWVAVNNIQKTIGHLFDEIVRCDRDNPLHWDPNYIHIKISKTIFKKHIERMRMKSHIRAKADRAMATYYKKKFIEHEKKIHKANERIIKALKLTIS